MSNFAPMPNWSSAVTNMAVNSSSPFAHLAKCERHCEDRNCAER
jgi:hypothetical protein